MRRIIIVLLIVAFRFTSVDAQAHRGATVIWTVSGAGAGFGVGLWAGLSAFDQSVNSDRKVWTSAVAGAGVGATALYLIARKRRDAHRSSIPTRLTGQDPRADRVDPWLLQQLAARWLGQTSMHLFDSK